MNSGRAKGLPIKSWGVIKELTWDNEVVSAVIYSLSDCDLKVRTEYDETEVKLKVKCTVKAALKRKGR